SMFILAPIIAVLTTIVGLAASYYLNLPSGPTIAVASGVIFLGSLAIKNLSD
ncbi:metal ABC transporter permease, partial [Candidatus Woesebacteria bacterium]|nr:metal ABC transporter permease [Candidatus Woesebacteria bacterium]